MLVMYVGDNDVYVVCVWRYINEWWRRWLFDNDLSGEIPSELGQLTNLQYLYVLFTPPSFHVAHSRALPFLSPARSALSMFYLFSTGFFVPLIVLVSTSLCSACFSLVSFEEFERRNRRDTSSRLPCAMLVMCVGDGDVHMVCV